MGLIQFELDQFVLNNCDKIEGLDTSEYKAKLEELQEEIYILQESEKSCF